MSTKEGSSIDWQNPQTLKEFSLVARQACLDAFGKDACMAATRVGIDTLRHFGIPAYPLTVQVVIFNEVYGRLLREGGGLTRNIEEVEEWKQKGAWSHGVGVPGLGEGPGKWPGHLVAIVQNQWLIDLSIGQANKPEKGIILGDPIICSVTEEFLGGNDRHTITNGALMLTYLARPKDFSYRQRADWSERWRARSAIRQTIQKVIEAYY